jgi:type III pantothenate kinase
MNLVIDQGNTYTKTAVYLNEELIYLGNFEKFGEKEVQHICEKYMISRSIISSVVETDPCVIDFLKQHTEKFILLDEETPLPIENLYKTPSSLGKDRIAVCVGANYLLPSRNLLVIDAGTAITYDVVTAKNQYIGGNISPGLEMRKKALHTFTQKLPLIEISESVPMLGSTTEEAILGGIVNGIIYEISGYINNLSAVYPQLSVFLTGGDANYFERKLKSSIFAIVNRNLLLTGLNRILNY